MPNQIQPPPFYLNQQQLHLLQNLQKNKDNLNPQQLGMFNQLYQNYRMMQQHMQQQMLVKQQQQQQMQMSPQQQQITSPNMMSPQQQGYPQIMPNTQNGMHHT